MTIENAKNKYFRLFEVLNEKVKQNGIKSALKISYENQ